TSASYVTTGGRERGGRRLGGRRWCPVATGRLVPAPAAKHAGHGPHGPDVSSNRPRAACSRAPPGSGALALGLAAGGLAAPRGALAAPRRFGLKVLVAPVWRPAVRRRHGPLPDGYARRQGGGGCGLADDDVRPHGPPRADARADGAAPVHPHAGRTSDRALRGHRRQADRADRGPYVLGRQQGARARRLAALAGPRAQRHRRAGGQADAPPRPSGAVADAVPADATDGQPGGHDGHGAQAGGCVFGARGAYL
ncbi:hypothetical protein T492DRAFT_1145969, partial [Pavlovales sp. CCMP2436]